MIFAENQCSIFFIRNSKVLGIANLSVREMLILRTDKLEFDIDNGVFLERNFSYGLRRKNQFRE